MLLSVVLLGWWHEESEAFIQLLPDKASEDWIENSNQSNDCSVSKVYIECPKSMVIDLSENTVFKVWIILVIEDVEQVIERKNIPSDNDDDTIQQMLHEELRSHFFTTHTSFAKALECFCDCI